MFQFTRQLKQALRKYMDKVPELKNYCERCLRTERWSGNVILMIVDASFTSIGLNYFSSVVPKVVKFEERFRKIKTYEQLANANLNELKEIWRNSRSWFIAKEISRYFSELQKEKKLNNVQTFRHWAENSSIENWKENPIGKINGVGINTYQYLRMMGGVDTVMPDKIVKRVIENILKEGKQKTKFKGDEEFVLLVEEMAKFTNYKAIEITWMTWLIQSEGEKARIDKYRNILPRI